MTTNRVWIHPDGRAENLVALAEHGVILSRVPRTVLYQAAYQEDAVREMDASVRYDEIGMICKDRKLPRILIISGQGRAARVSEVPLADIESRDELFAAAHERLGPKWEIIEKAEKAWRTPLVVMIFLAIVTVIFFFVMRESMDPNAPPPQPGKSTTGHSIGRSLGETVGPVGLFVTGGVLIVACIPWMVRWIHHPPRSHMVVLRRRIESAFN
jgi:hypothetical protein